MINEYKNLLEDLNHYIEQENLFCSEYFSDPSHEKSEGDDVCSNLFMGVGSNDPDLLVVSYSPFIDESGQTRAFRLDAGNLFTKMLSAMKISKNKVFITNLVKTNNIKDTKINFKNILDEQIRDLKPKIILMLGEDVLKETLGRGSELEASRTKDLNYLNTKLIVTYSPVDLIKDAGLKRGAWTDLQKIMEVLDL